MKPIIVGIDGSQAAIAAALWGVDEAISRAVPLRLIAIIKPTHPSSDDYARDLAHAEKSLWEAQIAIETSRKPVNIETEVARGPAGPVLVEGSRDAEMVCVGSVGIGRYSRALLGSTATEVAEKAHCPVAVIRSQPGQSGPNINWIVVAVGDSAERDTVVDQAMREAQLRKLPVLAIATVPTDAAEAPSHELDNRLWPWTRWYPDVHIYPVTTG